MSADENVSVCVATSPRPLIEIDANRAGHELTGLLNRAARTSYVRPRRRTRCRNAGDQQRHHRPLCRRASPARQDGATVPAPPRRQPPAPPRPPSAGPGTPPPDPGASSQLPLGVDASPGTDRTRQSEATQNRRLWRSPPGSRSPCTPAPNWAGIRAAGRPAAITVYVACRVGREIDHGIGAGFAVLSGSVHGCEIRWLCARPRRSGHREAAGRAASRHRLSRPGCHDRSQGRLQVNWPAGLRAWLLALPRRAISGC